MDVRLSGLSCKFFSHPNILLKDHLREVGDLCKRFVEDARMKDLARVGELIGKCHDFAKYSPYFQQHLKRQRVPGDLYKHSLLSAIFASWVVKREVKDDLMAVLAFLCVNSHHTGLSSFSELSSFSIEKLQQPLIVKQINSIKECSPTVFDELKDIGLPSAEEFIKNFESCTGEVETTLKKVNFQWRFEWNEQRKWKAYFDTLLLFSSLVDADRRDAAGAKSRPLLSCYLADVRLYKANRFTQLKSSRINQVREELFNEIDGRLNEILNTNALPSIFTLTAPTGSGKTLLGIHVALRLRERLSVEGPPPRIIYCLPYINIIEQTHLTLENVLSSFHKEIPLTLLLKHHHLFFPMTKDEKETLDKVLLLVESWNSEIVVTTFEQLLKSLIGNSSGVLRKFHNIANSVILLDEVQAIPLEYWKLVREILVRLTKNFNTKIILMTATMPAIFTEKATELLPDSRRYFQKLERVTLVPRELKQGLSIDQFVNYFFSNWDNLSSVLIVLNTIKTSKEVYHRIAKRLGETAVRLGSQDENTGLQDPTKIVLAYLSTSIVANERKRRVNQIAECLRKNRIVILVSTQVVEAGVDLDFDAAFRDIGPLDAIIQVAGRCNRNWLKERGKVHIVRIVDESGKEDSKKIYGQILPNRATEWLGTYQEIDEEDLYGLLSEYYKDILYRMNIEDYPDSADFLKAIKNLDFSKLSHFSLIREEPKIPLFIELNEEAKRLHSEFKKLLEILGKLTEPKEIFEQKALIRKTAAEMENYTVRVYNDRSLPKLESIKEGIEVKYIPHEMVDIFYDGETGFKS